MALSPNYSWAEPDNSSLVKNGASDIRTLGDAIDTSVWNVGFGQAGKNKIINGDFSINQRAFTTTTTSGTYCFDRWLTRTGGTGGTSTFSTQAFTAGAAPVVGYESTNFARVVTASFTGTDTLVAWRQRIEDVRTFANQTVTVSFWAKAATGTPQILPNLVQEFGSGGSTAVETNNGAVTISTSWARYSKTITLPSISGKTIGTSSVLRLDLYTSIGSSYTSYPAIGIQNNTFDFWGVQVEYGSKATPFQTASGGSPQAELAACQRYYVRYSAADLSLGNYAQLSQTGFCVTTQLANVPFAAPATLRTKPTSVDYANVELLDTQAITTISGGTFTVANGTGVSTLSALYTHTAATLTAGKQIILRNSNNVNGYFGWSAEL